MQNQNITLFGINISCLPKVAIFLIGTFGVFFSFLLQGIVQETLSDVFHFQNNIFLTIVQFFFYFLFSLSFHIKVLCKKETFKAPLWVYFLFGLLQVSSIFCANFSCCHLSYTTQIMFKSGKLIALVTVGRLFLKKKYSMTEFISAFIISIGIIGMSISDINASNKYDLIGFVAIIISLICDSFISNFQDIFLNRYNGKQDELISMTYGSGVLIIFIYSLLFGNFQSGLKQCSKDENLVYYIILFSFFGAAGVQFIFVLLKCFGSFVTTMITSIRYVISLSLSFILFKNKTFTKGHAVSIFMVFLGVFLNIIKDRLQKKKID